MAGLQSFGQSLFVDNAAPGAIEDASALPHEGDLLGPDEVCGLPP